MIYRITSIYLLVISVVHIITVLYVSILQIAEKYKAVTARDGPIAKAWITFK